MPHDIAIAAPQGATSLARIGAVLGESGIGLMGGGMWSGIAHYLVEDGPEASRVLADAGIEVDAVREVLLVPLAQDRPGELGRLMQRMIDAGVRLEVQYSDHDNRKVFVVDDIQSAARALS